ncbi:MAG: flavodoxin family protein [Gammaproteobacteria bacterium]
MSKQQSAAADYSDLRAVYINTTLKRSPEPSHTETLMAVSQDIMAAQGVTVEHIRAADYELAPGVQPDMTEHGFERDDWPGIFAKVKQADILVIGTPIWLGERSSICSSVVERLYAQSAQLNEKGQYVYYGKVGGCLVTGNEDGIKHVAMGLLYALQHLGYTIPPQADAGWIGEAGPGPSYGDPLDNDRRAGFDNEFTQRNTTFMTWNLMHLARMLKDADGIPAHGNQRTEWEAGQRFDHPNPEYR